MSNLITLEEYKSITGKSNDKDDALINSHLAGVSALIKTYCNRTFIEHFSAAKTETFSFPDGPQEVVFLAETPIVTVTSVKERGTPIEDYKLLVASQDYVVNSQLDAIYRIGGSGHVKNFCSGIDSVEVVYTAGFNVVPEDIVLAAADLVNYYIKDEHIEEKTNLSFTLKTRGSSSRWNDANLPDHIKRVLDMYRNVW